LLLPEFRASEIDQCVLEVLIDNDRAINVYENIGFSKTRYFHCFRMMVPKFPTLNRDLDIIVQEQPDWNSFNKFIDTLPSFLDTEQMIEQNLTNEKILTAYLGEMLAGYAIYQRDSGRISHFAVDRNYRNQLVGSTMLEYIYRDAKNKSLTVININKNASAIVKFLTKLGFENQLDQYEMIMKIE